MANGDGSAWEEGAAIVVPKGEGIAHKHTRGMPWVAPFAACEASA
jgi:hypothetical protein